MEFPAKIRKQSTSFIITIPNEVVKKLNLKEGEIKQFIIEDKKEE